VKERWRSSRTSDGGIVELRSLNSPIFDCGTVEERW